MYIYIYIYIIFILYTIRGDAAKAPSLLDYFVHFDGPSSMLKPLSSIPDFDSPIFDAEAQILDIRSRMLKPDSRYPIFDVRATKS